MNIPTVGENDKELAELKRLVDMRNAMKTIGMEHVFDTIHDACYLDRPELEGDAS